MLIGEVSRRCGVSTRMLRHYDGLGLVKPTGRTSGGYREYSADDIRRLFHVESLRTLGLSLNEAKRALDEPDFAPADLVGDLIRHTRRRIAAEQELLGKLERVDAASPAEWDDVLRVVSLLRALESVSGARKASHSALSPGAAAMPSIEKPSTRSGATPAPADAAKPKRLAPRPCALPLSQAISWVSRPENWPT